jgi:hydrophobic/amphiphilic exporter-1 (mainly G- bacteria), HAE1 family
MSTKFLSFFLNKPRLNYALLLFMFILGLLSYNKMPKELFPSFELDTVMISGAYAGASADTLDKMAVDTLEDQVTAITGVKEVSSTISAGQFSMLLTLASGSDKSKALDDVKDAISLVIPDLPSDMNEPTARVPEHKIPLIQISVSSQEITRDELIDIAKDVKSELSKIPHLSDLSIYGEGNREIRLFIDMQKLKGYQISSEQLIATLSSLSYIFPIGKVEHPGEFRFVSTYNGKKEVQAIENTLLRIGNKRFYLKDVASVRKSYSYDTATISSFNAKLSLNISISKDDSGNAIALSKKVKERLKLLNEQYPNINMQSFSDTSVYIKKRLNTVTSNIMFGLILVIFVMLILINKRISFIVGFGIPTSFIIAIMFLDYAGYSINMLSLMGALIALGVIVDDAIIVAENIQRHVEEGMEPSQAALVGSKEVIGPVIAASLTTIFAFIPMLLMSGEMGTFIKIIPIAISVLILASLIESFIFLPLHAKHFLKTGEKESEWAGFKKLYLGVLRFLIHWRKSSVTLFLIATPLLTAYGFSQIKFQFFPKFDGTQLYIAGELPSSANTEDSYAVANEAAKLLMEAKDELFIESVIAIGGMRMDAKNQSEVEPNLFFLFVDLKEMHPVNVVEKYITPYLAVGSVESGIRDINSWDLRADIEKRFESFGKKHHLHTFEVRGQRAGVVTSDIDIALSSSNNEKLLQALSKIKEELDTINGVFNIADNAKKGVSEIKLKVNAYGESLGFTETTIASSLSSYYLENSRTKSFDREGLINVIFESHQKDNLASLRNFELQVPISGEHIYLKDVCDFVTVQSFNKLYKENGEKQKSVFANVKPAIITSTEAMAQLQPLLKEISSDPELKLVIKGEAEQKAQLMREMGMAAGIAIFLIFMVLLIMFDSFKYTLLIISVIPLSLLGMLIGHFLMGMNLSMTSLIGALGLAGVVINDGIIMLEFIRRTNTSEELLHRASLRLRPIFLTTVTTLIGLSTLILFPSGQAVILQPMAVSLGFGLFWGTVLNLLYLPTLFAIIHKIKENR